MTDIIADITVPYRVYYRPHRARKTRRDTVLLFAERKVSIAVSTEAEAPPAYRLTSADGPQESEAPYTIRSFDGKFWWPVPDRHNKPVNAAKFMEGLASGTSEYIEILNPAQLWYSAGRRPTFEEYFAKRPKDEILENHLEGNFAVMQRLAAQILLCGDTVHFAGGVPALFGSRQGGSSDRSISLSIGNLGDASGPRLPGAYPRLKELALQEGHVFDLNHLSREIALMESRGMTVDLTHTIESVGGIAPKNEALHLCAHTALTQLFGASSEISAAYRDLIPDTRRVDGSKLVPLQVCREIFIGALQRRWPENSGKRHVSSALASAAYALARVEMNAEVSFTPEEDEALASIV